MFDKLPLESNSAETKNALKAEHLKDKGDAIIACVGTLGQFSAKEEYFFLDSISRTASSRNVDYYADPEELARRGFKNAGNKSFVMSPIDNSDKVSQSFINCTGLLMAGRDKMTGKNISFLSHQSPAYFLKDKGNRDIFTNSLRLQLEELKKRSVDETIDAIIIGGNYFKKDAYFQKSYLESIGLLSAEVLKIFRFEPVVITGPKMRPGDDDVYYNNDKRRLYIIRPETGVVSTESFLPSDIKEQEKKWQKDK